jgi:hypothetical protein
MKDNLIDSSVWIEYFKGNRMYSFITDLIYANAICTNDKYFGIMTKYIPLKLYA